MKKRMIIMTLVLSLLCISACSGDAKKEEEVKEPYNYETLAGTYYEQIAGRGELELSTGNEDGADVKIHWSSSAAEYSEWSMHIIYNEENGHLEYQNGSRVDHVFDSEGNDTSTTAYTDGSGYFETGEGSLTWYEDNSDDNDGSVFVKEREGSGMPNPWTETDDLEEAMKISGVTIDLPPVEVLPEDISIWKYVCMDGVFGALYEGHDSEMLIRKSSMYSCDELSGDFNEYSASWDINLKGLNVSCQGDGETVNCAKFSNGTDNYVISYNAGQEGHGLSVDQISSLIKGLQ